MLLKNIKNEDLKFSWNVPKVDLTKVKIEKENFYDKINQFEDSNEIKTEDHDDFDDPIYKNSVSILFIRLEKVFKT